MAIMESHTYIHTYTGTLAPNGDHGEPYIHTYIHTYTGTLGPNGDHGEQGKMGVPGDIYMCVYVYMYVYMYVCIDGCSR